MSLWQQTTNSFKRFSKELIDICLQTEEIKSFYGIDQSALRRFPQELRGLLSNFEQQSERRQNEKLKTEL